MYRANNTNIILSCLLVAAVSLLMGRNQGVSAASEEEGSSPVTYGSAIKLTHIESSAKDGSKEYFLNSEAKNLGSGSGQQIVTMLGDKTASSTFWLVREGHDAKYAEEPGTPVPCGSIIRLTHLDTNRNLHSHDVPSALSRQQEVTGFGNEGNGDRGDNFKVVCSGKTWKRGEKVRFYHQDTRKYLGASSSVKFDERNCGNRCPILHHLEAFARKNQDVYSEFKVDLGVHLSK
mmetsp:Transcript_20101/g.24134  ORF Transcript_20101/g.24134 Transcript_20101/m.24134 type:complete len:233 (+) Transcript_20101:123-821(+)|eukprot:CAMPEP_0195251976 /NCGR_PEP_ID=MMETSP0706-20130129/3598_1 /TAXON_ID=33640 /ORGANISM="Asterionellopsis glacialis, Strain CCMP134" /LENGTH=232 /DNA_ID=CAMNT_0040304205 /DNA_START=88 /DNA_END=786 /DNA_ORIENTATION=+